MDYRFAFLASGAEVGPDGRFFVLGGGIDAIGVPHVPIDFQALAVLVRVHFDAEEVGRTYQLGMTLTRPDRTDAGINLAAPVTPELLQDFLRLGSNVDVAFGLYNLPLPQAGEYTFHFSVDGRPVGELVVGVRVLRQSKPEEVPRGDRNPA